MKAWVPADTWEAWTGVLAPSIGLAQALCLAASHMNIFSLQKDSGCSGYRLVNVFMVSQGPC